MLVSGSDAFKVQGGKRAIARSLHANRMRTVESTPCFERTRARKTKIASNQNPIVAASLGGGEDSGERIGVAVDVRDTEKTHHASLGSQPSFR